MHYIRIHYYLDTPYIMLVHYAHAHMESTRQVYDVNTNIIISIIKIIIIIHIITVMCIIRIRMCCIGISSQNHNISICVQREVCACDTCMQ